MKDVVLGEILVAKIRQTSEGFTVDSPSTVYRSYGMEHVIEWNYYPTFDEAYKSAIKLVPEECRPYLKVMASPMRAAA
jgi:hypothetical protein